MAKLTLKPENLLKMLGSKIHQHLSLKMTLTLGILLVASSGCREFKFLTPLSETSFKMQVSELVKGTYEISGETDLPENSKVAVAAVRYLKPGDRATQNLASKPTYSILDYQLLSVQEGKWRTSLKLLKDQADRQPQEVWQIEQSRLNISLKPEKDIIFLATLASDNPVDQLQNLEQQLAKRRFKIGKKLIYTTVTGQQYIQISQIQEVAPPKSDNLPWKPPVNEINGGWGKRYLMPPEAVPPYKLEMPKDRKTNAPAKSEEFLK